MVKWLLILLIVLSIGCATSISDIDYTWGLMQDRLPECRNIEQPEVVIDERVKRAVYVKSEHRIYWNGWDYNVLVHEFKHACGIHGGEKPLDRYGW